MPYDIGRTLKKCRNDAQMSVKQVSELLTQKGYKASESTIYSWENGNSQPTPGALLIMCKAYGITNVLETFGYSEVNEEYQPKTMAAHFEGDEFTDDEWADIEAYAEFVRNRRRSVK